MSRKLFGLRGDSKAKQKTIKVVEETVDGPFERRVSVSNSGRWKQKTKHRSVVNDDLFTAPKSSYEVTANERDTGGPGNNNRKNYSDDNKFDRGPDNRTAPHPAEDERLETAL